MLRVIIQQTFFSYLKGIPNVFTSKGAITESPITNSANIMTLETHTLSAIEKPILNTEMNTNYLEISIGVIIAMLFFIILKQFCKPSQSLKQKAFFQRERNIDQMCNESSNHPHKSNEKEYKSMSSSLQMDPNFQQMDTMYHEIDECMELNKPSDFLNAETDPEDSTDRFEFNDLTTVLKNDDMSSQTSSLYLLPCTGGKSIGSDTDKTDVYLQPTFIPKNDNPEDKEEIHSYIDVTG